MTITAADLVRREVHYCASSLISTLAASHECFEFRFVDGAIAANVKELQSLTEQAFELAAPVDDWEDAAREAGWRHCPVGWWNSERFVSSGSAYDAAMRGDVKAVYDTAHELCAAHDIDPYEREVFEHWIVSDWLADKLAAKGEKIDKDFAGLTIWARTTTGQAIAIDSVIEEIAEELNR